MPITADRLKRVFSHLPGGVCVVTSQDDGGRPRGLTAISVCSASMVPPLVLACIERGSNTHAAVENSGAYALNFLGAGQARLAERFSESASGSEGSKFDGVPFSMPGTGAPILADAVAACDCTVVDAMRVGDHTVFIGRVEALFLPDDEPPPPLIRYRGRYVTLHSEEV